MRYMNNILVSSLLVCSVTMAMTAKVDKPKKAKGTSVGAYAKPGAPIDIKYTTEYVEVAEVSRVDVTLLTSVKVGSMHVDITLDKGLQAESEVPASMDIALKDSNGSYALAMQVSADKKGIYYVNLITSIKGRGFRAFSVPIYVDTSPKEMKKASQKTNTGDNLSIAPAKERVH